MRFSQTHYHGVSNGGHEHEKITTFVQGGKTYDGMVHTLQNYYGKRSGFVVELRDETEHYQALELFEHYNQKLTEEVDAKTQQIASIQEKIILGMEVYMSRYEYGVLSLMAQHPGKLFTKEQIFEAVWHKDSDSYLRAVTSTIGRIRQKIEDDRDHPPCYKEQRKSVKPMDFQKVH